MNNYSPLDYIKIDIANQLGLDKLQFEARIQAIDDINNNPDDDLLNHLVEADKPYQYMAAIQAYNDAIEGKPSGHLVGLDACSSGITLMGIFTGCEVTSSNTGIIGSERKDMYTECTKAMNNILDSDIEVPRKDVKAAQMTHYYGSKAEPKNIFGDGTAEYIAFYEAQEMVAPGASWLMDELLASWQPYAKSHDWIMPDGFEVKTPVLQKKQSKIEIDELDHASIRYTYEINEGTKKGLAIAANAVHSCDALVVRELNRRCNYDHNKLLTIRDKLVDKINNTSMTILRIVPKMEQLWLKHNFVSLIGIDIADEQLSLDYCNELLLLIDRVLEYPPFECIFVHDEFKCHPNHMNRMREMYVEIMAELAESNIMQEIISQVRQDPSYKINKLSNNLGNLIRESEYFLS